MSSTNSETTTETNVMVLLQAKHAFCDSCEEWVIPSEPVKAMTREDFVNLEAEYDEFALVEDIESFVANLEPEYNVCLNCANVTHVDNRKLMDKTEYLCLECGDVWSDYASAKACCS